MGKKNNKNEKKGHSKEDSNYKRFLRNNLRDLIGL